MSVLPKDMTFPSNPPQDPPKGQGRTGWICPTCHRSISPAEKTCPFCPAMESTTADASVVALVEGNQHEA